MEQRTLSFSPRKKTFSLPDADLVWVEGFLESNAANELFQNLRADDTWRQDSLMMFGRSIPIPRLHRWFADDEESYSWSGITMRAERFPTSLQDARQRIDALSGVHFNTALANLYRDGNDSVSWHADDEPELGRDPLIASLSLGAERKFRMRRRDDHSKTFELVLSHGSLLLMAGQTQGFWEHCVPKTQKSVGTRINLTFRSICRRLLP